MVLREKILPAPVSFQELADEVLEDEMKDIVNQLLETKKQMVESEKGPRIDHLNKYIENNVTYYKQAIDTMTDDRTADWDKLNEVFINLLL